MKTENTDNKGFALSSFPHHGCLTDEKKDRTDAISSFLVGEPFDECLMKNYPADCQMLTYGYHQIISLSGSTSSAGRTMHTARQCTTGLMLAQERVFPTGGKYRSLLGDFSSRTNKLVLKIPNRPRCCTPLDSLPRLSAGAEHKQKRETNETEYQTNKT
jgi:hypothetical protein